MIRSTWFRRIAGPLVLWLALLPLASPAQAATKKDVALSSVRGLLKFLKTDPQQAGNRVLDLVKGDRKAQDGLHKLVNAAVRSSDDAAKGTVRRVGKALTWIEEQGGPEAVKRFLRDVDDLDAWARGLPQGEIAGALKEIDSLAKNFAVLSRGKGPSRGYAFELQRAAHYARRTTPPKLKKIQPKAAAGENVPFRDLEVGNGETILIEAKSWFRTTSKQGSKSLRKQVDSHLDRLRQREIPPVCPPATKLLFEFHERLLKKWQRAIEQRARQALRKHWGCTADQAKAWVEGGNLQIETVAGF